MANLDSNASEINMVETPTEEQSTSNLPKVIGGLALVALGSLVIAMVLKSRRKGEERTEKAATRSLFKATIKHGDKVALKETLV